MGKRDDKGTLCGWEGNLSVHHVGSGGKKVGLVGKENKQLYREEERDELQKEFSRGSQQPCVLASKLFVRPGFRDHTSGSLRESHFSEASLRQIL